MRELKEKWIKEFISLGPAVNHNGETIRPNTTTSVVVGKVARLDDQGNNNLKCVVKVPGAKYDFSGFLNGNTPVSSLITECKEKDVPLCVRFERKRKKTADPSIDIKELTKSSDVARDNIVWIVAGVFNYGTEEWILTDDAVSNPEEDPDYVVREVKNASYSTEGFFEDNKAPKLQTTDLDWKVNHLLSMYNYAKEHSVENGLNFNENELRIIASYMLKSCDVLQMKVKSIPSPLYNDYSHTKARGLMFSWMKANKLSREIIQGKGEFNAWISRFLEESISTWSWANSEVFENQN